LGKFELNLEFIQTQHHAAWDYAARAGLSTDTAAQHYGRGPPVSPWVSLFVWHGDTRARRPGAIADRPEPPAAILGPLSFLLPPLCGAAIPIPPTLLLSPGWHTTLFPSHPSSSTATIPLFLRRKLMWPVSITGHRATPPDLEPPLSPPRLHSELHLPWFSTQFSSTPHFPSAYPFFRC
jgi:hypothetical protein